ncbi:MAG: hypothetical protein ACYDC3_17565 [Candidatus Binataceae bacterium]
MSAMLSSGPFAGLARGLWCAGAAKLCDDSCERGECQHAALYDFDWKPAGELLEKWNEAATAGLVAFIARLGFGALSLEEIESRLEWWWRGEDRALRRAMERVHSRQCERGRGILVNRITGQKLRARCKSWRECTYCAWVYGCSVQRLGDWSNKEHLAAQARARRRLAERLNRKFGHRSAMLWAREHNTHCDGAGRLHLNVVWDEDWVNQAWLSAPAEACGFGRIVDISRVGKGARLRSAMPPMKPCRAGSEPQRSAALLTSLDLRRNIYTRELLKGCAATEIRSTH